MTRKRFTKLLMAGGWSPRAANSWAWAANETGTPYGELYHELEEAVEKLAAEVMEKLYQAGEAVEKLAAEVMEKLYQAGEAVAWILEKIWMGLVALGRALKSFGRGLIDP